ncbi:hypothetical protein DICPUDRAFT_157360 [Dictyostelium purpureum]|uniref:Uncharacterized protein n=1 Tax=Dictyostelium purpureum TaxID=5786 RepID=F0ZYX9_DICPU|nr:uncharacterized protein DICPUDRAFT_157360 [Dictyostelium purpureum]EGC30858.1 hypothetical protein DICPUDRAFT_157360 [Dictyostelium purpureum]|eukprot:XP_003292624.1 hypothetical protein DICPUDRAFT_157360 [Dictyostelium purpureum]
MNKLLKFLFIFIFSLNNVTSQSIPLFTQIYGYFDQGNSWSFDPSGVSEVGISNPNGVCIARYPINKETIHVGFFISDANITFVIQGAVSLSKELIVNKNCTTHFDNQSDDDGTEILKINLMEEDSVVLNTGRMSGKKTHISNKGVVRNNGDMRVSDIQNIKGQFYSSSSSYTQLNGFLNNNGYSYFSGTVNFNNNSLDGQVLLKTTSETIFKDSLTTINMQNIIVTAESSLNIQSSALSSIPFNSDSKCSMKVTDSSWVLISNNSNLDFTNTTLSLTDSAKLNISNSKMYSDSNIKMKSYTTLGIKDSGLLSSNNFLASGYSTVNLDQNSVLESKNLILFDNSKMHLDSSIIDIGIKSDGSYDSSDEIIDLPDKSKILAALANSSSITAQNSSTLIISGAFGIVNNASIFMEGSSMSISKSFRSFDKTSINGTNSKIEIKDQFDINDESSFLFKGSSLDITGSFSINSNKINIQREFFDSNIKIDGKLYNIGKLSFEKSKVNLNKNFTSIGQIKSNQTNYSILLGQFNLYGFYDGIGDTINLLSGQMNIAKLSSFNCENCQIDSNGSIKQFKSSKLKLFSSSFTNRKGNVEMDGDFSLDAKSKLTNAGEFILQSDIVLNDNRQQENDTLDTLVLNQGNFTIKGENTTNVFVDFENRGSLVLQQNSIFKKINQYDGNISLSNQVDIQSNQTIELNGGSLFGNGSVTAESLNNKNATLGSKEFFYQLNINGNYTQGENGKMIVTIDSTNKISLVNISGSAIINGTLIVRMNKNMVENSSNYNKSMIIMHTNEMQGGYSSIQFKTYDPETGEEQDDNNDCNNYQVQSSKTSFSVLLNGNSCKKDGLTTPQIIGIAVGGFVFVAIGVMVASYFVFTKYRYSENSIKLKKIISKFK